jgi:S-adenosylmethionine:tRNA ribosyltransferase-isomerase
MVGGIGKWKQPEISMTFQLGSKEILLSARIVERKEDVVIIAFNWDDESVAFSEIMSHAGQVPLPPYLKRKAEAGDRQSYQTVYAQKQGSVAAPTAGLHFTERLLNDLKEKGVDFAALTLHVGAGTFLPVKSATMSGHNMHKEWIVVGIDLLNQLMDSAEKNVIAVGTTSLRTLETLYWMGVKALREPEADLHTLEVQQWDPYQISAEGITKKDALNALATWMRNKGMLEWIGTTQLLIAPGYKIKMADAILTNFHQPASTLLLLVAACIGEDWRKVYQFALENDYRFLSYGDGSLLWCRKGRL